MIELPKSTMRLNYARALEDVRRRDADQLAAHKTAAAAVRCPTLAIIRRN